MKKLFSILLLAFLFITAKSQIIYTFDPKTPVYENDLLLGTDSVTYATSNFKVIDIGKKIQEVLSNSQITVVPLSKTNSESLEDVINTLDTFRVDANHILMFDITVSDIPGKKEIYISKKDKGLYGKLSDGGEQYLSSDLLKLNPGVEEGNVFLEYDYANLGTLTNDTQDDVNNSLNTIIPTKADKSNVLELDNTTPFTPDADYEPATKKYVDDEIASGSVDINEGVIEIQGTYANLSVTPGQFQSNVNSSVNSLIGSINGTLSSKADKTNVLELNNTTLFTPDADYEPATKKYVDDSFGGIPGTINEDNVIMTQEYTTLGIDIGNNQSDFNLAADGSISSVISSVTNLGTVKADKTNVLELNNTTVYTPTLAYHPATKDYVDDIGMKHIIRAEILSDGTISTQKGVTTITCVRTGEGVYTVFHYVGTNYGISSSSDYFVHASAKTTLSGSQTVKVSSIKQDLNSFTITLADDVSSNDNDFRFIISLFTGDIE